MKADENPDGAVLRAVTNLQNALTSPDLRDVLGRAGVDSVSAAIQRAAVSMERDDALVAFVGSFSSGKSTLINQLVGHRVLPTGGGVVTACPVVLGPDRNGCGAVSLPTREGSPLPEDVPAWVLQHHGDVAIGQALSVDLPSWPFDQRLRLVDTPGFNSEVQRHAEHSASLVRQASVAVVVVEPRGLAADVKEFLKHEVLGKVPEVVFVLNQMDLVDASEIPELIGRCRKITSTELGLSEVPILVCSARGVVSEEAGLQGWEPLRLWLNGLAKQQVSRLIARRVAQALQHELSSFGTHVAASRSAAEEAIRALEGELRAVPDDDSAEPPDVSKAIRKLDQIGRDATGRIESDMNRTIAEVESLLVEGMDVTNQEEVTPCVKSIFYFADDRQSEILRTAADEMHEAFEKALVSVQKNLKERWASLGDFAEIAAPPRGEQRYQVSQIISAGIELGALPSMAAGAAGGAAIGAAIGSILPGIGTLFGAVLGGALGGTMSAGSGEERAREVIRQKVREATNETIQKNSAEVQAHVAQTRAELKKAVKRLMTEYRAHIEHERSRLRTELEAEDSRRAKAETAESELRNWAAVMDDLAMSA